MVKPKGKGIALFPDASIQKQGLFIPVAIILATWGFPLQSATSVVWLTLQFIAASLPASQKKMFESTDHFMRDISE